jgi:hypothetical protein
LDVSAWSSKTLAEMSWYRERFEMKGHLAAMIATLVVVVSVAEGAEPVVLAGEIVCRLADPGPYGSVGQRVAAVDKRICEAISNEDVGKPQIVVTKKDGLWSVVIGKTFLVSVYPLDAQHYNLPAEKVAALWAARFKELFPLAEPAVRFRARQAAGGNLPPPRREPAERPPVKVPEQHWGLVDRLLLLLWEARQVPEEQLEAARNRFLGEVLEIASLHYFTPSSEGKGHEPGTCPSLRNCAECQADMDAAVKVPDELHDKAVDLARKLSSDEVAVRAVGQTISYVRSGDQGRFMKERVRTAWTLWRRLAERAKVLTQEQERDGCAAAAGSAAGG